MNRYYADIIEKLGEPTWWDENAVPRYCEFSPSRCANVYADEVILLEIACQNCGQLFRAALSTARIDRLAYGHASLFKMIELADASLHYGDPPNNECCPAGPTMGSEIKRVLEYWRRDEEAHEWVTVSDMEIRMVA